MKSWLINISLILCIVLSCVFVTKGHSGSDMEHINLELKQTQQYLRPGTHLSLTTPMQDMLLFYYVNFAIAPAILDKEATDTSIVLLPANTTDSIRSSYINNASVIWQNKDDKYQYILIKK